MNSTEKEQQPDLIKTIDVNKFDLEFVLSNQKDVIVTETPVALVYNGISHVVMMATAKDLEYFAIGFSLTEWIINSPNEIYNIDIVVIPKGIEVQIELSSRRFTELKQKRRNLTGRTGCGICGTEQIDEICRILQELPNNLTINLKNFSSSLQFLNDVQIAGNSTGCTHAAVWMSSQGDFIAGFEDIGRHVALDKLLGFRSKQKDQSGVILVSSRASYEMVQKAISCGVEILLAVSATTSKAVDIAKQYNLTLIGFFRGNKGVVYSGSHRIK